MNGRLKLVCLDYFSCCFYRDNNVVQWNIFKTKLSTDTNLMVEKWLNRKYSKCLYTKISEILGTVLLKHLRKTLSYAIILYLNSSSTADYYML